ncbi:alpha/beta hydrolase [Sphingomonas bacterium]|uniref:alpha/beta hydrolase n=1 Tax=Sphingomonas bacterium TaxID=1895847 RepID=UPI0020C64C02|nr:alpha/beta fold hydrolase [Sphingomonas bacterium]
MADDQGGVTMWGLAMAAALATGAAGIPVEAPGPNGPLAGTLLGEGTGRPVVIIVPGSGPTDRDGNNALGITAAPYRLLAEALAAKGVASVRIDKRGMFGSKAAIPDANHVTMADYAADVHAWAKVIRARTGAPCVWVLGHSEGGLVALVAGQDATDICGLILVSAAGRPLGVVLREQIAVNPGAAPLLPTLDAAIAAAAAGRPVDPATPPPIARLFPPQLATYWQSTLGYDPATLIVAYHGPVLILQGTRDIQVSVADAKRLAAADPRAHLVLVEGANHVLKHVGSDDRAANVATYSDSSLPIADGFVAPIVALVSRR